MTEKIHQEVEDTSNTTLENSNEANEQLVGSNKIEISEKAKKELEEEARDIAFRQSETAEDIRRAQAKKGKEVEKFEGVVYQIPKGKSGNGFKNWSLAAFAGLLSLGASAKESKNPEAELKKDTLLGKTITPSDSLESKTNSPKPYEQKVDGETIGHIKVEGHILIPQKDTTKEVYVYYFSDDGKSKNNLAEIVNLMKQKGFVPIDGDLLEDIYNQNKNDPEFNKKVKWVVAPTPEGDEDDTRRQEGVYVTTKGKTAYLIPENAVLPTINPRGIGRFEIKKGFDPSEYGVGFYLPKNESGNSQQDIGTAKK